MIQLFNRGTGKVIGSIIMLGAAGVELASTLIKRKSMLDAAAIQTNGNQTEPDVVIEADGDETEVEND